MSKDKKDTVYLIVQTMLLAGFLIGQTILTLIGFSVLFDSELGFLPKFVTLWSMAGTLMAVYLAHLFIKKEY